MKKMICAAALWLFAASLALAQTNASRAAAEARDAKEAAEAIQKECKKGILPMPDNLKATVTGTGRTTGVIANLCVHNPTGQTVSFEIPACFIPSGGQYQPYIMPNVTPVSVPPHSTANVPLHGYCADIHTPPVPAGAAMPPVKDWVAAGMLPVNWSPSTANGWKPAPSSSALIPGTDRPLGHTIDPNKHPTEAAFVLLDALARIAAAYDDLKNAGAVTTPFSGNPEKEREAVIQQTFWMYAAEVTGKDYEVEGFSKNTIEQFEVATGQKFNTALPATRKHVEDGVTGFWNTFEAVGVEAKVLVSNDVDYDKITKAEDLPKLIRPAYDRYSAARALGASHEKAMKDAFSSEDARDEWAARFKRIYGK